MMTEREAIIAIIDNDCIMKCDAAILLEGDGFNRVNKAADLYKKGLVERIVFSGDSDDKDYGSYPFKEVKPFLLKAGIKESDIIHENKSLQTRQQAIEIVKLAIKNRWSKLALVASHEHQYRAYLTFLREIIDTRCGIVLYNVPARNLNWFVDEGWGIRFERLFAEFERIEKYSALGHLATPKEVIEYQKWKESMLNE